MLTIRSMMLWSAGFNTTEMMMSFAVLRNVKGRKAANAQRFSLKPISTFSVNVIVNFKELNAVRFYSSSDCSWK